MSRYAQYGQFDNWQELEEYEQVVRRLPHGTYSNYLFGYKTIGCEACYDPTRTECQCYEYVNWEFRAKKKYRDGGVWSTIMAVPEHELMTTEEIENMPLDFS